MNTAGLFDDMVVLKEGAMKMNTCDIKTTLIRLGDKAWFALLGAHDPFERSDWKCGLAKALGMKPGTFNIVPLEDDIFALVSVEREEMYGI